MSSEYGLYRPTDNHPIAVQIMQLYDQLQQEISRQPGGIRIHSPNDAAALLIPKMSQLQQEEFKIILLSVRNDVIGIEMVYRGAVNNVKIRIAEVFRPAILQNAYAVILAHNHPSGDPMPSSEDIAVTKDIVSAGKLLGIEVIDHLIIGEGRYKSMKELHYAIW